MSNDIDKFKQAVEKMDVAAQNVAKDLIRLLVIQQERIELLTTRLQRFMDITGPNFSTLQDAFSKTAQNTFSPTDAIKTVSDIKTAIDDKGRWLEAVLKGAKFAKGVIEILK